MFTTMAQVRAANRASGQHWFSPNTMAFFRTRVCGDLRHGEYFITSEIHPAGSHRVYTIRRVVDENGTIDTVGEFMAHATIGEAKRALMIHRAKQAGRVFNQPNS